MSNICRSVSVQSLRDFAKELAEKPAGEPLKVKSNIRRSVSVQSSASGLRSTPGISRYMQAISASSLLQ